MRIQSILILLVATAAPFISSSSSEPVAMELGKVQGRKLRHVNKNQPEGDIIKPDLKGVEVVPMMDSPQLCLSHPCCCQCTAPPCKCSCKEPMDTKKGGYLNINDIMVEAEKKAAAKKRGSVESKQSIFARNKQPRLRPPPLMMVFIIAIFKALWTKSLHFMWKGKCLSHSSCAAVSAMTFHVSVNARVAKY